jgi:hypothetical protein
VYIFEGLGNENVVIYIIHMSNSNFYLAAVWYILWSFGIFFPFWHAVPKKLATLYLCPLDFTFYKDRGLLYIHPCTLSIEVKQNRCLVRSSRQNKTCQLAKSDIS